MPALIHTIYVSAATHDFGQGELTELLEAARRTNRRRGVTGMLLHAEGTFFQILEGHPLTVDALYERISRDTRHTEVAKIIREPIAHRSFGEWTMGFSRISRRELAGHRADPTARLARTRLAGGAWARSPIRHRPSRSPMSESVYVINEIVGTSSESWEDAARAAIATAGKNVRDLRVAEVVKMDATIEDGAITSYRVRLNVSFKFESD